MRSPTSWVVNVGAARWFAGGDRRSYGSASSWSVSGVSISASAGIWSPACYVVVGVMRGVIDIVGEVSAPLEVVVTDEGTGHHGRELDQHDDPESEAGVGEPSQSTFTVTEGEQRDRNSAFVSSDLCGGTSRRCPRRSPHDLCGGLVVGAHLLGLLGGHHHAVSSNWNHCHHAVTIDADQNLAISPEWISAVSAPPNAAVWVSTLHTIPRRLRRNEWFHWF